MIYIYMIYDYIINGYRGQLQHLFRQTHICYLVYLRTLRRSMPTPLYAYASSISQPTGLEYWSVAMTEV